jgi:hypothetical protein
MAPPSAALLLLKLQRPLQDTCALSSTSTAPPAVLALLLLKLLRDRVRLELAISRTAPAWSLACGCIQEQQVMQQNYRQHLSISMGYRNNKNHSQATALFRHAGSQQAALHSEAA